MITSFRTICSFLLLGAIINIGVAWSIGTKLDPRQLDGTLRTGAQASGEGFWGWFVVREDTSNTVRIFSRWSDENAVGDVVGDWPQNHADPLIPYWAPQLKPSYRTSTAAHHHWIAWAYGWPAPTLGGTAGLRHVVEPDSWRNEVECAWATPLNPKDLNDVNKHWDVLLLTYKPVLPGFAINTAFYAASLWIPVAVLLTLHRWNRARRGRCPACAYPVGTSPICTECGKPVKARSVVPVAK